jgi:hypothetical protein
MDVMHEPMRLEHILDWHLARYPLLGAGDVYKLLHQGVFGPAHFITDGDAARARVTAETATLEPRPGLPEVEPLDPDGRLVRVNLAPLIGQGRALDLLAELLCRTAAEVKGDARVMKARLKDAVSWAGEVVPHLRAPLVALAADAERARFPAGHHTELYLLNYCPAYRVVLAGLWPGFTGSE